MGLLDGGLRSEIGLDPDILSIMLPAVLTKITRTLVQGRMAETPVNHNVLGFMDTRRTAVLIGGASPQTESAERIVVILGLGPNGEIIPEPKAKDKITIEGQTNAVKSVERDPAGATWTMTLTEVGA